MNRNRLLNEVKKELIGQFKGDSYNLRKVVPYYVLIQKDNHPLLLELIEKTNNKKFYINYSQDPEDAYSYGTMSIHFGETIEKTYEIEEYNDDKDFPDRYLQKDEIYFEIELEWRTHGSCDEYTPRIIVRKCNESKFIDCNEDTSNEYIKWYSELGDLRIIDNENRKKQIEIEIQRLIKEKDSL